MLFNWAGILEHKDQPKTLKTANTGFGFDEESKLQFKIGAKLNKSWLNKTIKNN